MTRGQFLTDRHERAPREQARFIELFAGARLAIRRTLLTYLGHAEDADDLLQETGVVLWERFEEFEQSRSFASWACGIAANKARMLLRDRRRHRTLQLSERAVANLAKVHAAASELHELRLEKLEECLGSLPDRDRGLLRACHGRHGQIADWARAQGRPEGTVRSRLTRLRRKLYDCVNRKLGLTEDRS